MHEARWRRWLSLGLAVSILIPAALACAQPAATTSPQPSAATGGQQATGAEDADWPQILAAARQEGRVSVNGPASSDAREALTEGFERKYPGIRAEYMGNPGSAVPPKLIAERDAGQFLADIVINGTTTQLDLQRAGVLDPLPLYLLGPDARDPSPWLDGKLDYADKTERYNVPSRTA
jgi:ABC-type glycerol-3-phosphate transport system substrate-binding protein